MAHWYDQNGALKDGGMRMARKENLLPGVTDGLKILDKPGLERYKLKQLFNAIRSNGQIEGESEDEYFKRVIDLSKEHSEKAATNGSTIHALLCRYLKGDKPDISQYDENIRRAYKNAVNWIDINVKEILHSEQSFINSMYGYGGTIDLHCILKNDSEVLIDFKSQETKSGKVVFYPEWCWQLAAYTRFEELIYCESIINIVLSTSEDLIKVKEWSLDDWDNGWQIFRDALRIWNRIKKYDPIKKLEEK